jgi:hypothetical protein
MVLWLVRAGRSSEDEDLVDVPPTQQADLEGDLQDSYSFLPWNSRWQPRLMESVHVYFNVPRIAQRISFPMII